ARLRLARLHNQPGSKFRRVWSGPREILEVRGPMVRIKDLDRSLIQWVHVDLLSSPDPAPLLSPPAPHPRYPRRPSDSDGSDPGLPSDDSDPELARQPADSPVYVPREVAFPDRVTRSGRVSRPPRRDPYVDPLCAMAFPPKIPSLLSLSTQSNPRGHMSDLRPRSVYPVDSLDAAPSATPALQPAPAQRYPLCTGPSLSVEPCMLPLDPYSAYGHSHPSRRPPLSPGALGPAPPPVAAGHFAPSIHPRPPNWPESFAFGALVYVWSSRDAAYYVHTGRYEYPNDAPPPDDALIGFAPAPAAPTSLTPDRHLGDCPPSLMWLSPPPPDFHNQAHYANCGSYGLPAIGCPRGVDADPSLVSPACRRESRRHAGLSGLAFLPQPTHGDRPRDRPQSRPPHHPRARFRLTTATCYLCGVRGHLARSCPGHHGSSAAHSDISAWSLPSDGSSSRMPSAVRPPKRRPYRPLPCPAPASLSVPSISPFIGSPSDPFLGALPAPDTPRVQSRWDSALSQQPRPWLLPASSAVPATKPMPRTHWPHHRCAWPYAECAQVEPSTRPCGAAVSARPYALMAGAPRAAPLSPSRRESRSVSPLNPASMVVTPTHWL
ncbi:MAG: OmpA/MotB domain-containing protein, partial [Elusimicrobia bacterium]